MNFLILEQNTYTQIAQLDCLYLPLLVYFWLSISTTSYVAIDIQKV